MNYTHKQIEDFLINKFTLHKLSGFIGEISSTLEEAKKELTEDEIGNVFFCLGRVQEKIDSISLYFEALKGNEEE